MVTAKFVFVVLAAALLTGCFSNTRPQMTTPLSAEENAQYAQATPAQLIADAAAVVQKAHAEEFSFFAPGTLKRLEEQLKEIKLLGSKPTADKRQIIGIMRSMEQMYRSGTAHKVTVQAQLSDVLEQKKMLEKLSAARLYPSDYKDALADIADLVEYIENGKPDKARGKTPSVMQDMRKLEIRIVKDTVLGRATALLAEAKDKDVKDLARKGYDEAALAYERAVKFIDANPRDQEQVAQLGHQATFLAQRSVRLAEEVAKLKQVKPKDLEQVVVENEQRMQRIAEAMRHPDVRDLTLTEQSVTLANAAEKLANQAGKSSAADTEKLKADLVQAQENIKKLEASLAQASAEKNAMQAKLDVPATQISGAAESVPAQLAPSSDGKNSEPAATAAEAVTAP